MITGAHTIVFAEDAEAARVFCRDVLELPSVDAGDGWLIFKLPPGELACHPADGGTRHQLYLMCDDIEATIADLAAKGVEVSEITDAGFGRIASLQVPGAGQLDIYEPRHPTAYDLPG